MVQLMAVIWSALNDVQIREGNKAAPVNVASGDSLDFLSSEAWEAVQ